MLKLGIRGQGDHRRRDRIEQRRAEESQPDGAAARSVAVDLGEDVSEDVRDGEKSSMATRCDAEKA